MTRVDPADLRNLRVDAGLSLRQMAEVLGVTVEDLRQYERGLIAWTPELVER